MPSTPLPRTLGLLLAAGAGRRMGRPKALVETDGVAWVVGAARVLRDGGCSPVVVVVGAEAESVAALLSGEDVRVVEADDWADGMGASLAAGLRACADDRVGGVAEEGVDAALVHLVDLPDVGADVVARMLALAAPDVLARADYGHGPGHPVLLGRDHWPGVVASAHGDEGARRYLGGHDVIGVPCQDLAGGVDVDGPAPGPTRGPARERRAR